MNTHQTELTWCDANKKIALLVYMAFLDLFIKRAKAICGWKYKE